VAQREGTGWRILAAGREGVAVLPGAPLTFRLLKAGYRELEVEVPPSQIGPGTQVWPPAPRVLVLEPLVTTATFHTWPSGARLWLPVPGGGREYLGLSGKPLSVNLARLAGESGQGVFQVQVELAGFHSDVLLIPSHSFQDRGSSRWPPQGEHSLRPRWPVVVTGVYLARQHPLGALLAVALAGVALRRGRPPQEQPPAPTQHLGVVEGQLVPLTIGNYRLGRFVGSGGMGLVYEASPSGGGDPVALKIMRPGRTRQEEFKARVCREVQALSRLSHPHILRLLDWGEQEDGLVYLVMELADGTTLRDIMMDSGLALGDFLRSWAPLVEAVDYAHGQGVVHRDLKPENVLLSCRGPLVADFGLCRLEGTQALTASLDVLGTPGYLAPELLLGQAPTPASDQYALGIIAHELLCGQAATPWSGAGELARRRPDLPPEIVATVERMLSPIPAERFPALSQALQGILSPAG